MVSCGSSIILIAKGIPTEINLKIKVRVLNVSIIVVIVIIVEEVILNYYVLTIFDDLFMRAKSVVAAFIGEHNVQLIIVLDFVSILSWIIESDNEYRGL